jgi:DNA-binding PadR family transcriptional regulator
MSRRFFRHRELPLVLLALLAERPMHGYELLSSLKRLFGPRYSPSPGSIYPALEALEAEGLLEGESDGGRKVYRASAAGAEALGERADNLAELELRTGVQVRASQSLEATLSRFKARIAPLAGQVEVETVAAALDRAATEIEHQNGLANKEKNDD